MDGWIDRATCRLTNRLIDRLMEKSIDRLMNRQAVSEIPRQKDS